MRATQDSTGRIQLYVTQDAVGADALADFKAFDLGDILGCEGTLFRTKTGELSVKVAELRLLTKSLRPLPEKFHGLADQETKYRQRYVDLIMNEETRRTFKARTAAISSMRRFMEKNEFMEVETPMLQSIPGGAAGFQEQVDFVKRLDGHMHTKTGISALMKNRLGDIPLGTPSP